MGEGAVASRCGEEHPVAHPSAADRLEPAAGEGHQQPSPGAEGASELVLHRRVSLPLDVEHRVVRRDPVEPVGRERERGHLAVDEPSRGNRLAGEVEPAAGDVESDATGREVRERPRAVATADVEHVRIVR